MNTKLGSVFRRFLAYLLDVFICMITSFFLGVLYLKLFTSFDLKNFFSLAWYAGVVGKWAGVIIIPLYFIWFEHTKWQATPGKKLLGLKVVDLRGNRLSLWRSCIRVFLYMLIYYTMFVLRHYVYSPQIKEMLSNWSTLKSVRMQLIIVPEYFILRLVSIIWFITIFFTKNKTGLYEILSRTRVIPLSDDCHT